MKIRVAACQQPLHEPLSDSVLSSIQRHKTDFLCLPEHYPLPLNIHNLQQAASRYEERKQYLTDLSVITRCVIVGGTLTEETENGFYNTCYVFESGKEVGSYRKVHPTSREQSAGVLRGKEFKAFDLRGVRFGVLICADVLNRASFEEIRNLGCVLTFIPTASPYREGESLEAKVERDKSIFLEGARIMNSVIVKTCGVGSTFGHRIQGRSLIATPDRILARAEPQEEDSQLLLSAELDL